jgi:tetratricopeptide (TPR) repeat protein
MGEFAASSMNKSSDDTLPQLQPIPRYWVALAATCLLLAVLAAYSNHFQNGFHFDDSHSVETNPYIRSLANIPRFFADARTFSSYPPDQNYRPLVSTSLALDYRMAGGLHPFWFQVSTFAWFLVQLALNFLLFRKILDIARPAPANPLLALFMVAWYGLHPAMAETVNYIMQRGDVYSTLGVIGGLCLWALAPGSRRWGAYLVPVILGALSKPPALMFAPILFLYILLFELPEPAYTFRNLRTAALQSLPAWVFSLAYGIFHSAMTPKEAVRGGVLVPYWVTQPYVWLRYFLSFFYPNHLNADTDLQALKFDDPRLFAGIVFVIALLAVAWLTRQRRELRPICFGIAWFCLALLPTSLKPLAEVENDHRMFFPFVGLTLAVGWSVACLYRRSRVGIHAAAACGLVSLLLVPYAVATHERNEVWRSEASLWYDVTVKSPQNARGLMNYGLTRMAAGDYKSALDYFNRALVYAPAYMHLEVNLGIANGAINNDSEAEAHFRRALSLAPNEAIPYYYYARWLYSKQRTSEAISLLQRAIVLNNSDSLPRYLLMQIYSQQADYAQLAPLVEQTASLYPDDPGTLTYVNLLKSFQQRQAAAESLARTSPSPQNWLQLSLLYHQAGRYQDCIAAATEALKLKPDYADAYNNIAAGYQSLHQWDDAIRASQQALKLNPNLQIAKNNLAYSTWEKQRTQPTSSGH